jgi:hypothetical protein
MLQASQPAEKSAPRHRHIRHKGYLKKQGGVRKNWLTRWFVLWADESRAHSLDYYDDEGGTQKGSIDLHAIDGHWIICDKDPCILQLPSPGRMWRLKASTQVDAKKWLTRLEHEEGPDSPHVALRNSPRRKAAMDMVLAAEEKVAEQRSTQQEGAGVGDIPAAHHRKLRSVRHDDHKEPWRGRSATIGLSEWIEMASSEDREAQVTTALATTTANGDDDYDDQSCGPLQTAAANTVDDSVELTEAQKDSGTIDSTAVGEQAVLATGPPGLAAATIVQPLDTAKSEAELSSSDEGEELDFEMYAQVGGQEESVTNAASTSVLGGVDD